MNFHGIPIGTIWTAARWLPPAFLKYFFSKERLSALQYIDLRARHEPATLNLGENASFSVWLQLINLSPFEVEIDRAEFEFSFASVRLKSVILKKRLIAPGEIIELNVEDSISDSAANQIARHLKLRTSPIDAGLSGNIEFNCNLHNFARQIPYLSGISPRLLNEASRCPVG